MRYQQIKCLSSGRDRSGDGWLHMPGEADTNKYDIAVSANLWGQRYLLTRSVIDGRQHYVHGVDLETGASHSAVAAKVREAEGPVLAQLLHWAGEYRNPAIPDISVKVQQS